MNKRFFLALVSTIALPLTARAQTAPAHPDIVMKDQFDATHNLRDLRGAVVVLVYGDRAAAEANKNLGERLHVHFHPTAAGLSADRAREAPVRPLPGLPAGTRNPEVRAVPIACIGSVPGLIRGLIKSRFRDASPIVPVWLDFEDRMKSAEFTFKAGLPNLIVLDAAGGLRYAYSGTVDQAQFERLTTLIEALRKEAVGAK